MKMDLITSAYVFLLAAFVGLYILVIVACVPGPSVMGVAGGFLFGPLVGGAATLAAALVGSTIVFLACRTAFGEFATMYLP